MGEGTQVLFQDPIHDFSLAVGFRVVRRAHAEAGATEAE